MNKHKEKKLSKVKIILILVIVFILVATGILLIMYPSLTKKKTADKQRELVEDVKDEIIKNADNNKKNNKNNNNGKNTNKQKESIADIDFEENDIDESKNSSSQTEYKNQEVKGIIEIKKLDLMFAIVEGAQKANLSVAICHIEGTAEIGENGNCVLAGHRGGIYGQFFKHINKLSNGDEVVLTDLYGDEYTYIVYESSVVEPTDTFICNDIEGKNTLTMVTCENKGKQRLVVRAELKK